MSTTELRKAIGPQEHIAVVGPRASGQTTIAMLLSEFHAMQGKKVKLCGVGLRMAFRGRPHVEVLAVGGNVRYDIGDIGDYRPKPGWAPYDVVIHDGYLPQGEHVRVVSTSEIF